MRASRCERAAGGRKVSERRHRSWNRGESGARLLARDAGEQPAGVRMRRGGKEPVDRGVLDDASRIHDGDAVSHRRDDAEVVRDEQQGEPEFHTQIAQQVQHFGLHRRIERRRRLIGNEQIRIGRKRKGDHRALLQAAAQLMRIFAGAPRRIGHANGLEEFHGATPGRRAASEVVRGDGLGNL